MRQPKREQMDKVLLFAVVLIAILGIFFLYSATWTRGAASGLNALVIKQILWIAAGLFLLFVIANIDYIKILDFAYLFYGLNLIALLMLLIYGGERYGAKRWIDLGLFSLQPSEFVKITAILALALLLEQRREKTGTFGNFIAAASLIAPAFLLIFLQPDLGTAVVFVPVLFAMLYICGERVKYILITTGLGMLSMPVFWSMLKAYQKSRLLVFINPNIDPLGAGYTIIQSKIAIGSGGLFGKGWLRGTQSHLKFLPERHTDFIFSVIGEEWGFFGAFALISLYALVIARGVRIISDIDDIYGKAIAGGIVTLLSFQILVNISMTVGLMPVVGLPLPVISYGGSSTVVTFIAMGFLLSISRRVNR